MRYLLLLLFFSLKVLAQQDTIPAFSGVKLINHYNGVLKARMTYKNGVADGPCTMYDPRGYKSEEGTWHNGRWIGQYTFYYESGRVQQTYFYDASGRRVGLQRFYYPNGILQVFKKLNSNGREEGYELLFDMEGKLKKKPAYYVNGTKTDIVNPEMPQMMLDIVERENATVLDTQN